MKRSVAKFRMMCPDCGVSVVTDIPEALTWELCPSCKRHVWDAYDVLMAEVYSSRQKDAGSININTGN